MDTRRRTNEDVWTAAFRSAVVDPHESVQLFSPRAFDDETVRQVIKVAGGGSAVRVVLTNRYGRTPLVVGAAHLADRAAGPAVVAGTDRALRFEGEETVTIPAGGEVTSDPLERPVGAGAALALTLHLPGATGLATYQVDPREHAYVLPGDAVASTGFTGAHGQAPEALTMRSFVAGIDVLTEPGRPVVVMFGDSYIEGTGTTLGADRRVSDLLGARLDHGWVVNTGIAGNRLLADEVGERGLRRFDRDALDVPGATHVLIHLGLNDLGLPGTIGEPAPNPGEIVDGLAQLAGRARDRGLVVVGMTLGPSGSAVFDGFDSPEVRRGRAEVDAWILGSGAFDGVVDVTAALTHPQSPDLLRTDLDAGDGLHFNDAGALAVANAVDVTLLTPAPAVVR
jgi:lysophospholipase L1-like esterase